MNPIGKTLDGRDFYGYGYRIVEIVGNEVEIRLNEDTIDTYEFPQDGSGVTRYWALQRCNNLDKQGCGMYADGGMIEIKGDIGSLDFIYEYRGVPAVKAFWFEKNRHDLAVNELTETFYVNRKKGKYTFKEIVEDMSQDGHYVFDPLVSTDPNEDWYESIHISQYKPQGDIG